MRPPRIVSINDVSGYGRCSLTVALPILSVMGIQCCPLLTAWLSTHTGGFEGYTFNDLTDALLPAWEHWRKMDLKFEAVYSGFLGSEEQIDVVGQILDELKSRGALVIVDPVMADCGAVYTTYTARMCHEMINLAEKADVITPNPTEAALMLDLPLESEPQNYNEAKHWVKELSLNASRSVVLTGVSFDSEHMGAVCFDREHGEFSHTFCQKVPCEFPGTGDIFASVLTGALMQGCPLEQAAALAVSFVRDCMELTFKCGGEPKEGVYFEPLLKKLCYTDK